MPLIIVKSFMLHRELSPVLCDDLDGWRLVVGGRFKRKWTYVRWRLVVGGRVKRKWTYVYLMADSL